MVNDPDKRITEAGIKIPLQMRLQLKKDKRIQKTGLKQKLIMKRLTDVESLHDPN